MLKQLKQWIHQGKLTQAIEECAILLKDAPKNFELRSLYIEALCLACEFERADQQLHLLLKQSPEYLPSVVNMRQLVHAAQARVDFYHGANTATLVGNAEASFAALIKLRLAMREGDSESASQCARELEDLRQEVAIDFNDKPCGVLRDVDDTLAGFLELIGSNGKFYLVPYSEVEWLKLLPAESLFESVWRKAEIEIHNGPSGEVFIPLTYISSRSDSEKLGLETNWEMVMEGDYYQGRGQKVLLVDEDGVPISELESLSINSTRNNPSYAASVDADVETVK